MNVRYTEVALRELDDILAFIASNYPTALQPFQRRLHAVEKRIAKWPQSTQRVVQRPGVHVAPLIQYPYKLFYLIADDTIEILHIHHSARRAPWEDRV